MPADYQIIDPGSALVWSALPYKKTFFGDPAHKAPYFVMWVKTGYQLSSSAASVRVNGTEIDKIFPRPWLNQPIDVEAVSFFFNPSLLIPISWHPGPPQATLEIVPKAGLYDYVFVSHVIYHWRT
jgi:hypothetical protein